MRGRGQSPGDREIRHTQEGRSTGTQYSREYTRHHAGKELRNSRSLSECPRSNCPEYQSRHRISFLIVKNSLPSLDTSPDQYSRPVK